MKLSGEERALEEVSGNRCEGRTLRESERRSIQSESEQWGRSRTKFRLFALPAPDWDRCATIGFWTSHERSNASHELKASEFRDDGGSLDPTRCWSSRAVL